MSSDSSNSSILHSCSSNKLVANYKEGSYYKSRDAILFLRLLRSKFLRNHYIMIHLEKASLKEDLKVLEEFLDNLPSNKFPLSYLFLEEVCS